MIQVIILFASVTVLYYYTTSTVDRTVLVPIPTVPTVGTVPTVPSAIFKLASYVLVSNELGAASAQCSCCS